MTTWTYPDAAAEDALHKSRLLNVEEKPFRRLTKRLLTEPSPLHSLSPGTQIPKSTAEPIEGEPSSDDLATDARNANERASAERGQFREDVILDFAAFESSIVRIQFLQQSNAKERERYAAEKIQIEATAQDVRDSTAKLRIQLDEAQKTLAIRKTYDELAEKITSDKALKPRDEQYMNLEKLRAEIEDLERESKDHDIAWGERRLQFAKVVDEGARLRRLIRDEKEEVVQAEGEDFLDVEPTRGGRSNIGTPRPEEGGLTPMHLPLGESGGMTPRSRRGTPRPEDAVVEAAEEKALGTIQETLEKGESEMTDEGEVVDMSPQPDAVNLGGQLPAQPEKGEGDTIQPDQMDTS